MGMFSLLKGKGKAPDPSKRKAGWSVVTIYPYLFFKSEEVFAEVKKEVLPYLNDEEEEMILSHFQEDSRSFRAFIPKDDFARITKILADAGESPFKTFGIKLSSKNMDYMCCYTWLTNGCCGGTAIPESIARLAYKGQLEGPDDPRLKEYFILEHLGGIQEERERSAAMAVARESVADGEQDDLPHWLRSQY